MSLLDNQTKANLGTSFYALAGSGGGGGGSGNFSTINVSTIDLQPNGDINGSGSINMQMANGGTWSLVSTVSALDGTTPAGAQVITSSDNIKEWQFGLGNDGKAYVSTNAASITYVNPITHNFSGGSLADVSTLTVSSINGQAYPPAVQTGVSSWSPLSALTYIQGGATANLVTLPGIAQHSYRVEMPVRIQGWNAANGLSNTYAPLAQDFLSVYAVGNIIGNPAPTFTTIQMAQVSSLNNDWEGTLTGVFKTTANGNFLIQASTGPSVTYSTSVEFGTFGYVTDLGAI